MECLLKPTVKVTLMKSQEEYLIKTWENQQFVESRTKSDDLGYSAEEISKQQNIPDVSGLFSAAYSKMSEKINDLNMELAI